MTEASQTVVLVVDDGAFPTVHRDGRGEPVPFGAYENLRGLAHDFDLQIPLATTVGFLAPSGGNDGPPPHPYRERLVDFLGEHRSSIPLWNHGLTHSWNGHATEFGGVPGVQVPEHEQRARLERSQALFAELGLPRPRVFVPPAHGWEPGVTDRIARALGFESIAVRQFEKTPVTAWLKNPARRYLRTWPESGELRTLTRLGLGLPYDTARLGPVDLARIRRYIKPSAMTRVLVHRRLSAPRRPHHFFAHIQNFRDPATLPRWREILAYILDVRHDVLAAK